MVIDMFSGSMVDIFNSHFSRRGRLDIMATILTTSLNGSRKTNLIYKCNLSINQFKNYLDFLLEKGLLKKSIQKINSPYEVMETTKKGKKFLKKYKELKELLTWNQKSSPSKKHRCIELFLLSRDIVNRTLLAILIS